ncbi:MAG: sugar ABC transporter ATP-binding protein [Actinomycetales bacterium]|nr:sugar ABC transporter ATP-binding protein [Actinomycetales bacterium]
MIDPTPGDPELVLRVTRLSKTYATRVVTGVDWALRPGRVHALLGGNGSGKSTLLKMIAGVVSPDPGGVIEIGGVHHASESYGPSAAAGGRLRFVHQDLGLVDDLSIADNFALATRYPRTRLGAVDDRALVRHVRAQLERRGLDLDPRLPVGLLRPTERTLVAIARAFDGVEAEPAILVLDEPTASLPVDEVAHLFDTIRELRGLGHSIAFVSHRLGEVAEIADDVTILRDGAVVGEGEISEFPEARIVELIAGHPPEGARARRPSGQTVAAPALSLRAFGAGPLHDLGLDVHAGEIVGVAGLVGSGRSSLLRGIFGDLPATGTVSVAGRVLPHAGTGAAVRAGIAFVPEDRQRDAAYPERPVWENLSAAILARYRRFGRLSTRRERADAPSAMARFRVRAPAASVPLAALSGGNQQKVILARWLRADPRVLLLDEPTQGVDAVARDEIHELVRDAAERGTAVLVVSSDLEELEQLSHRVIVLEGGRLVDDLRGDDVTREAITHAMHETGA